MKISILPAAGIKNASARLRAFNLCDALSASGQHAQTKVIENPDILFIQKSINDEILKYATLIKEGGGIIIYDTDESGSQFLQNLGIRPEQWQAMTKLADAITTNTESRKFLLGQDQDIFQKVHILPDGIDFCPTLPVHSHSTENGPVRLIWFGYIENLDLIAPYMDVINSLEIELRIVTDPEAIPQLKSLIPDARLIPWQLESFPTILTECDLALLLCREDTHDRAKSNSKMLTCIANGVVPIIADRPEYAALANTVGTTDSIFSSPEQLNKVINRYASQLSRAEYLAKSQPFVLQNYGQEKIVEIFLDLAENIIQKKKTEENFLRIPSQTSQRAFPPGAPSKPENRPGSTLASEQLSPWVSVIIPTKDRPHLLAQALQSLRYQRYRDFEAVVINDGGCEVGNLIDFYSRHFSIAYARHPHSKGPAAARNTGLKLAKGEIVAYLDDDDYFLDSHLETVANTLKNTTFDFVYTDSEYVAFDLVNGKPTEKGRAQPYHGKNYSRDELLVCNYIPTPTWAHRANIAKEIGMFDESLPIFEDWDFLIRASAIASFYKIEQQTVEIRQEIFRSDHTLPAQNRQIPGIKGIYSRYPASSEWIVQIRERFLQGLENPSASKNTEPLSDRDAIYDTWITKHRLEPIDAEIYAEHMIRWPNKPRFMLALAVVQEELEKVAKTIASMQSQFYQGWQLIIISDTDAPSDIFTQSDILGWLRIDDMSDEEQIVNACNSLIEAIPCDWFALLPSGTELESHALLAIGDYIFKRPDWKVIYTDHDYIESNGQRRNPWLKPDFNLDYFRSMDFIGPAVWFSADALRDSGGMQTFPGAWQYDAVWRIHDKQGASSIGHIAEPLVHLPTRCTNHHLANAARQAALEFHLARHEIKAQVIPGLLPETFRVDYPLTATPLVSIIIPNRDCVWYLQPCIDSLFDKTEYPNFEVVIVDNQTKDQDTLAYYDEIRQRYGSRLKIIAYDFPFNFSAQCNLGARESTGEYLLFLNNDTEIIQPTWLSRLVAHGLRPEVGVVGARLVFPGTGEIQHAGVILGLDRLASHGFANEKMGSPGYMNRLQVEQNYSAVTAACMLIRKSLFETVEGMDVKSAPVLFNDVDLCLKVREQGLLVVWTPYATLVHHESKSISMDMQELQKQADAAKRDELTATTMHTRWRAWLREDPAYNRHLSLRTNHSFNIDSELVAAWDCNFHDRPRVLAFSAAGGSGEYRFIAPLKGLADSGQLQSTIVQAQKHQGLRCPTLPELYRLAPDVLMQQVDCTPAFLEWQKFYRKHQPETLYVLMMDDLITHIPADNPNYRNASRDGRNRLRTLFSEADRVIVTTDPLAQLVQGMIDDVKIIPNTLRDDVWLDMISQRRTAKKPRVGWVGDQHHKRDLAIIADAVKQTANEVDWIFFGICPDEIRLHVKEYHPFTNNMVDYPAKLASLNLDLAVAPLELNPFNEAKSNLRLLEYGVLGLPVICTDILPYQIGNPPVKRVDNKATAWVDAIREHIYDLDAAAQEGDRLKNWVLKNHMLSGHLAIWFDALTNTSK